MLSFRKNMLLILTGLILMPITTGLAQQPVFIELPPPQKDGGKPLMQVLNSRHSVRSFTDSVLTDQQISNLLWAAFGVNREGNKRTAPSSMNQQEIDIYVFTARGVFLYDAPRHRLQVILDKDLRPLTGVQDFVIWAAVNLVYIADHTKSTSQDEIERSKTSHVNTGFIAQNVYLYCASEGLGCIVRGMVNRDELKKQLELEPTREIIVAQTVGYIKE